MGGGEDVNGSNAIHDALKSRVKGYRRQQEEGTYESRNLLRVYETISQSITYIDVSLNYWAGVFVTLLGDDLRNRVSLASILLIG